MEKNEVQPQKQQFQLNIDDFKACMLLSTTGDAMGYYNGTWQFNTSGKLIHQKMMQMTNGKGPLNLKIDMSWRYSDDTVMQMATAEGLIKAGGKNIDSNKICQCIAKQYKKCWDRMSGRAPGKTTGKAIKILQPDGSNWNKIPYNDRGCGCGGSMRSACIGLLFFDNIPKLIGISIEAGRMTHHNPIGYLGSMVAAYFTALGILKIEPKKWIAYLFQQGFPLSRQYVQKAGREVKLNLGEGYFQKFQKACLDYAKKRQLSVKIKEDSGPKFPKQYGIIERQQFYKQLSWNGWAGALGIDSVLVAYDALLSCQGNWQQYCLRGILHGGDNDSTGAIGGAWFGAYYGFKGVPLIHTKFLQDSLKLEELGNKLYKLAKQ